MPKCIGIDFGTTKSVVSWVNSTTNQAEAIPLRKHGKHEERAMVPTSVFKDGDCLMFGDEAEAKMMLAPSRYKRDFKLLLGENQSLIQGTINGCRIDAETVTEHFLQYLREECNSLGLDDIPVRKAVITYPVTFAHNPARLAALEQAAKGAGFDEVKILCEPEAAGRAFLADHKNVSAESIIVVDWGGGTLDVSLISIDEANRIRCRTGRTGYFAGDDGVGGERIDRLFLDYIRKRYAEEKGIKLDSKLSALPGQLRVIQRDKIRLDRQNTITVNLASGLEGIKVARTELEAIVRPFVDKAVEMIGEVLNRAKGDCEPSKVLLIGGTNRMPYIQKEIKKALGLETIVWQHARIAVSLGAAYAAEGGTETKRKNKPRPDSPDKPRPRPRPKPPKQRSWTAGVMHPECPHVEAGEKPNTWVHEIGYEWVNGEDQNDLRVRWKAGIRHPQVPHIFSSGVEGKWSCDPGYVLANPDKPFEGVIWKAGMRVSYVPHIFSDSQEGYWRCDDGYAFINSKNPLAGVTKLHVGVTRADVIKAFKYVKDSYLYIEPIPVREIINARNKMRIVESETEILALYDSCVLISHGDAGFVIVSTGMYVRDDFFGRPIFYKWDCINSVENTSGRLKINAVDLFMHEDDAMVDKMVSAIK